MIQKYWCIPIFFRLDLPKSQKYWGEGVVCECTLSHDSNSEYEYNIKCIPQEAILQLTIRCLLLDRFFGLTGPNQTLFMICQQFLPNFRVKMAREQKIGMDSKTTLMLTISPSSSTSITRDERALQDS